MSNHNYKICPYCKIDLQEYKWASAKQSKGVVCLNCRYYAQAKLAEEELEKFDRTHKG